MAKRPQKPEKFLRKPGYPGGKKALDTFVSENMEYPEAALKGKVEGTVKIKFDITHKGKTKNLQILSSVGSGCDEEAIRLVSLLTFTTYKHVGVRVTFHRTLNIHFRLPVKKEAPQTKQETQLQYQITPKKKKEPEAPKTKGGSYTYTINS